MSKDLEKSEEELFLVAKCFWRGGSEGPIYMIPEVDLLGWYAAWVLLI